VARMRTWRHSGFHVYCGPVLQETKDVVTVELERSFGDSPESEGDWARSRRASWAALVKLVGEADPLLCRCGSRMRIVSVIQEPPVVDRILKHVHYCFEVL